ncbi:MAG: hypothetical protein ABJH68_18575 [Ilumatobacter sp.]|uniref:hypothetical protein n=1 Tax=Ilumatobacter sp. TaxID=1967498 RepID=UPI003298D29A
MKTAWTGRRRRTLRHGLLVAALAVAGVTVSSASMQTAGADTSPATVSDAAPVAGLRPAERVSAPRLVSPRTEVLQAGVVGINKVNDTFPQTDISVAAIAEVGDTIYVGGKFTQVEIAATGQRIGQRFLAAFDRSTGAWIDSFRPQIDGNVWDLKATGDGRLIVAGQFSSVNGRPNTTGVAMLDAASGALDPTWRVSLGLTGAPRWPIARALDIEDGYVYIGGNFTRITGSDNRTTQVIQAARVRLDTGRVDPSFVPDFGGIVFDIDAALGRVYVAGNFLFVNGAESIGIGILNASDGSRVAGLRPPVRTSDEITRNYQQAVLVLDGQVWQAGSEHSRQVYRRSDHALIRSWISDPFGDGQALAILNGVVYSGSHASGATRLYQDARRWPGLDGATSSKPIVWMEAFNSAVPEHLAWNPQIGSRNGEGSWELFADSTGCLWTGGDFNRGSFDGATPRYVQGFAKFCAS